MEALVSVCMFIHPLLAPKGTHTEVRRGVMVPVFLLFRGCAMRNGCQQEKKRKVLVPSVGNGVRVAAS